MRSGTRRFITAAAVTATLGAGLGVASSAAAAEPASAATQATASSVQPRGWEYKIAYSSESSCRVDGAIYVAVFQARDYRCEGPYYVPGEGGGYEKLWELWLYR